MSTQKESVNLTDLIAEQVQKPKRRNLIHEHFLKGKTPEEISREYKIPSEITRRLINDIYAIMIGGTINLQNAVEVMQRYVNV